MTVNAIVQEFTYHSCPSLGIDCLHLSKLCFLKRPKSCQCSRFVPLLSKFLDAQKSSHTSVPGPPEMHHSLIVLYTRAYTNKDLMHGDLELRFMAAGMTFTNIKHSNCMVHMFLWDSACLLATSIDPQQAMKAVCCRHGHKVVSCLQCSNRDVHWNALWVHKMKQNCSHPIWPLLLLSIPV